MNKTNTVLTQLSLLFLLCLTDTAWSATKVVVIPMGGDNGSQATGTATTSDVLRGKTFSNSNNTGLTGTRYPTPLIKTGQDSCWDASGTAILCAGTGQDGDAQAGAVISSARFTDNGTTVTDNLTGLTWLKDPNCAAHYNSSFPYGRATWEDALTFIDDMNSGVYASCSTGDTDWRMSNLFELQSMLDLGRTGSTLVAEGLPVDPEYDFHYWTSTTYPLDHTKVIGLNFNGGVQMFMPKSSYECYFWPVRGGL